jgi:hypothetical protein
MGIAPSSREKSEPFIAFSGLSGNENVEVFVFFEGFSESESYKIRPDSGEERVSAGGFKMLCRRDSDDDDEDDADEPEGGNRALSPLEPVRPIAWHEPACRLAPCE